MTTVVEALNRIARQCSVKAPGSWITSVRDDQQELLDFLEDTAEDVLDRVDLPSPVGAQVTLSTLSSTLNSDGSRTFTLPTNFHRLHRSEKSVYDRAQDRRCEPVTTDGEFTFLVDVGTTGVLHYYKVEGYQENHTMTLYNDPGSDADIVVSYSTPNWLITSGSGGKMLLANEDILLLPRRLVEAGVVYRFREREGLPYMDKYNEYEVLMTRHINDSRNRRVVSMGETEFVRWQDMVPAFIPAS